MSRIAYRGSWASEAQKPGADPFCVPWKNIEKKYIGETGRQLKTRIKEHRKEAEKVYVIQVRKLGAEVPMNRD